MTDELIRTIFINIVQGLNNHGSFLTNFGKTIITSDLENFNLLRDVTIEIIEKYNLNQKPYTEEVG